MDAVTAAENRPIPEYASTFRTPIRWRRAFMLLLGAILAGILGLGFWPVPPDNDGNEAAAIMAENPGGLAQRFPQMLAPDDNLPTNKQNAERVALGRLLFFDPVLSGNNDISCATCHHPDLGLSDGLPISIGDGGRGIGPNRTGGTLLRRRAPSLWNVGYYHRQFWDGRARDLEEQAISPIISEQEMNEDPKRLESELKQIPEYVERFDRAFQGRKGSSITLTNVAKALAAFERTLTANHSPFDRFVEGDRSALTEAQWRGFMLFRSGKIRCIECHGLPTFADQDFKAIGPLDSDGRLDLGRFEVTKRQSDRFAFKIPTLRNVVLSAPYMHNGSLKSLDDVIDFYSSGGGPRIGTPVDDKLRSFLVTTEERRDLVAFLYSLTDESNLPTIPDRVPSGLPVVPHLDNPARQLATSYNQGSTSKKAAVRGPQVLRVVAGQSIQATIDMAIPGDTIEVLPGSYHEQLIVDVDNLTLRAAGESNRQDPEGAASIPADGSRRPLLDGKRKLSDGIILSGKDFKIEGFDIKDFTANAIFAQYARGLALRDLRLEKSGRFGLHTINSRDVTIEHTRASGMGEAGFYFHSSSDIQMRNCETDGNVVGINVENCLRTNVEANSIHDNTCGVLVSAVPADVSTVAKDCRITGNRILNNNAKNISELGTLIAEVPRGIGILVLGADNTEVYGNELRGNTSYAVGILGYHSFSGSGIKIGIESVPEDNFIHDNVYSDNGSSPDSLVMKAGFRGGDLVWDLSGWSNKWHEPGASQATPLLNAKWPAFIRRIRWRWLSFRK